MTLTIKLNSVSVWHWKVPSTGDTSFRFIQEVVPKGLAVPGTNRLTVHSSSDDFRSVGVSDVVLWWQSDIWARRQDGVSYLELIVSPLFFLRFDARAGFRESKHLESVLRDTWRGTIVRLCAKPVYRESEMRRESAVTSQVTARIDRRWSVTSA